MSKFKYLLDVISDLRSLADNLQMLVDISSMNEPEVTVPAAEPEPEVKAVTLEQVRAKLAEKSQDGFNAEIRVLLEKHGAKKLSEIDPANYAALLSDVEGLK